MPSAAAAQALAQAHAAEGSHEEDPEAKETAALAAVIASGAEEEEADNVLVLDGAQ